MKDILQFVVPALFVLAGVMYTQKQVASASQRAAKVDEAKVDAAAYERAREFDREVVAGLREELTRARNEIVELRATIQNERKEHALEVKELNKHIDRLEQSLNKCIRRLHQLDPTFNEETL